MMQGRNTASSSTIELEDAELRPGGMLVQRRNENDDNGGFPLPPQIRLKIRFNGQKYRVTVSSQATFGEVKKELVRETGLQVEEQQILLRGRERKNGDYLDVYGVKDKSKLKLIEDPTNMERRYYETKKQRSVQLANHAIASVSMEVDDLANQVSAIEASVSKGVKVAEVQITTLIEMLMRQAVKLDGIAAEGGASKEKILQGMRVRKCVETLDMMKIANGKMKSVVVTTDWETFDQSPVEVAPSPWHLLD